MVKWTLPGRIVVGIAAVLIAACASTAPPIAAPADAQTARAQQTAGPPAVAPNPAPAPVSAQVPAASPPPGPAAAPAPQIPAAGSSEYRLDTGDELKIVVFGEQELSGTFIVSDQGDISMSLIGEVAAKNLTLRQLQRVIEARYRDEKILRNPQVSAEVVNYRPFYISGEVNKPGEYPYISGLTLRNAIATAGDFTYRADKRRVLIKRAGANEEREVEVTPATTIQPGDTIRVRECFFVC